MQRVDELLSLHNEVSLESLLRKFYRCLARCEGYLEEFIDQEEKQVLKQAIGKMYDDCRLIEGVLNND